MLQTTWIALLLGFWSSLYLIDAFFKSYHLTALHYLRLLEETGISISIGQLRWYTTCFNRLFLRLGQFKPLFMHMWFSFGVAFGLISMVISLFVLTLMVFNTLSQQPVDQQVLTPVMPGVNLPTSQMSYYLLTLLICGILHEFGHALAAVREQVHVNGFGFFILILYPGAFVEMSTEHLKVIAPIRQLRIYCAGVWHNFIIVLAALLVLLLLPTCLLPFYTIGNSVVVSYVVQGSAVSGPRGLVVGDPITSISGCRVTSIDDWYTCIAVSIKEGNLGNCMALNVIQDLDTSMAAAFMKKNMTKTSPLNQPKDCCNQTSNTHLCFMYHVKSLPKTKFACLPARTTTDRPSCKFRSDCYTPKVETTCVYPALDNKTRLLRIIHGHKPPLLFLGDPLDLHYSVAVSNYVPNNSFIPISLPYIIETFCKYLISLSGALVIINVIPCYALDGQWICRAFIEFCLRPIIPNVEVRNTIYSVILIYGTIILLANVFIAMWTLFS
ncbi:membrane-bound transcription factor site-2 protease [Octopus bimaculoides]|uniref:Membrane-bound transcription factor site-2 protease n=1 Tax=Octopus bimaculoides TaxID=37653 RepID=A0A0L8FSV4_OCTBM|nr:membrane-bound transcription factor site-2 protease [Octopus bimaculoides]|eukprot:XP_014787252.1 PREDICTED: membrane-bound transcription factor site-2 protease-like [Octopus bimaculoides]